MKKLPNFILVFAFLFFLGVMNSSCSRKTGCPMNDPGKMGAKSSKDGTFKSGKSRTNLFPKDMRKKSKKGR